MLARQPLLQQLLAPLDGIGETRGARAIVKQGVGDRIDVAIGGVEPRERITPRGNIIELLAQKSHGRIALAPGGGELVAGSDLARLAQDRELFLDFGERDRKPLQLLRLALLRLFQGFKAAAKLFDLRAIGQRKARERVRRSGRRIEPLGVP